MITSTKLLALIGLFGLFQIQGVLAKKRGNGGGRPRAKFPRALSSSPAAFMSQHGDPDDGGYFNDDDSDDDESGRGFVQSGEEDDQLSGETSDWKSTFFQPDTEDTGRGGVSFGSSKQGRKMGQKRDSDKQVLYDAYNQLHVLAQSYDKPFDAPAVVVVGHQSSGKSALIEALMGFQFNQVGGGTKTRRPVALQMQYNKHCHQPKWYLLGEDGVERPMSLSEIQDYIDKENVRLEKDPVRSFDSREINIRMEYKHCPNMILIDTPGLISAPKVPKGKYDPSLALEQQRALQAAAREAEKLVVEKMRCPNYIILCVEDTNDWKHGATREVVQKADPDLSRTVIVNTKFDTKVPQFGSPSDIEDFIRAPLLDRISPHKLGGPFFTSVPSGRVGRTGDDVGDFLFDNDDQFFEALDDAENADQQIVLNKLKRIGKDKKVKEEGVAKRIGLSNLRDYLEAKVDETYKRNVQKIVPMLRSEYMSAEKRLKACERELEALSLDRLKAGADAFCDEFCQCLRKTLKGSIVAPVETFGETLDQEYSMAGSFTGIQGSPIAVSDRTWDRLVETEVGHKGHKLYGGSQYHRILREFHLASRCLRLPAITQDEIATAGGIGETHDGVNFLHAACTISLEKARVSFEPMLRSLQVRMIHVMDRLCPVAEFMVRENRDRLKVTSSFDLYDKKKGENGLEPLEDAMDISANPQFRHLIRTVYEKFVRTCADSAMAKCRDDLMAITKYVTWNLNEKGSAALGRGLPDQTDIVAVYRVALQSSDKVDGKNAKDDEIDEAEQRNNEKKSEKALSPIKSTPRKVMDRDYKNLLTLMDEAVMSRDAKRTDMVVGALVQHIVTQWRMQFCSAVIMKFNCYFMLPFVDEFHRFVRLELQKLSEGDDEGIASVFDLSAARRALKKNRDDLYNECMANKKLQEQFRACSHLLID